MHNEEEFLDYLEEGFNCARSFDEKINVFEAESQKLLLIQGLFRDMHTLKANTGCFELPNFENTIHKSESIFNLLQKKENGDLDLCIKENNIQDLLFELSDFLQDSLKHIETNKTDIPNSSILDKIEFVLNKLDDKQTSIKEKTNTKKLRQIQLAALAKLKQGNQKKKQDNPPEANNAQDQAKTLDLDENLLVKLGSINDLSSISSELMLARNQLGLLVNDNEELNNELYNHYHKIDVLVQRLSDRLSKVRIQPISIITDKLQRTVRNLAKDFNKEVEFISQGTNIKLDRSILESLKDSLVHIFRNAIDHGLETPEERIAAGKSSIGHIKINARYGENSIILSITDDGRGLDLEKIKAKALEKKIVSETDLKTLSKQEIFDFIFNPSFSTKEQVSKISGRGVGMNIVKESIQKHNGSVAIDSKTGEGTSFIITLPLTLAVGAAVIVDICQISYAIPNLAIKELAVIKKEELLNKKTIEIREEFYDVIFAQSFIEQNKVKNLEEYFKDQEELTYLIVQTDNCKFLLVVDEILDMQNIVIKPLPKNAGDLNYCSGTTILPSGDVALIFEVNEIYKNHTSKVKATNFSIINLEEIKPNEEIPKQVISFKLGEYLFALDRKVLKETVYKKNITPLPSSEVKGLMNLRDQILVNKKLSYLLGQNTKSASRLSLVLDLGDEPFAVEVDDIEDFLEITDDYEIIKNPDPKIKSLISTALTNEKGENLYLLKEELCKQLN